MQNISRSFRNAFELTLRALIDSDIDISFSGSTAVFSFIHNRRIYTANVGDSRAIIGTFRNGVWDALPLSTDHKPTLRKEAEQSRDSLVPWSLSLKKGRQLRGS